MTKDSTINSAKRMREEMEGAVKSGERFGIAMLVLQILIICVIAYFILR